MLYFGPANTHLCHLGNLQSCEHSFNFQPLFHCQNAAIMHFENIMHIILYILRIENA